MSKRKKFWVFISIICVIIVSVFFYFNNVVNPIIISYSEAKVRALAQHAVSSAIYEVVQDPNVYDTLITITTNTDGEIVMISSNAVEINRMTRLLTRAAQTNLETIGENGVDIPIGTFSGMPILVGRGPAINIKLVPVGSISSSFVSLFEAAGINQTNHKIYLNINSHVNVILPTQNKKIDTSTQMLICESIIIGKVPEVYLNSNSLDNMLDLIP